MSSFGEWIIRCPRLGGELPFSYCEHEAGKLPCRQIVRCWSAALPVEEHLRETLAPEEWERFCREAPKDRMATILEVAETAGRRREEQRGSGEDR